MSDSSERVTCPSCGKGYRWQTKLIDRHVPCKACGTDFIVPTAPGEGIATQPEPIGEDGIYELDLNAAEDTPAHPSNHAVPANNGKCPSCNSPIREGAILCLNCGFNMAEGKKIQTPEVTPLPEQDRRDMRRELTGMKWVRVGLWLNLLSILLMLSIVPVPIAAAFAGLDFLLVISIIGYSALGLSTLGSLLCLTAPKESGGRPILIVSVIFSLASSALMPMNDLGHFSDDQYWIVELMSAVATVCFLYFFVMLARYLGFDQITERAEQVLSLYIAIELASFLLLLPIIGCITLIFILAAAIYTLFLYIGLLIDLNNALTYHISEQSQ